MPHVTETSPSATHRTPRRRLSLIAGSLHAAARVSVAEPEIRGLAQLIRPGDICFDVGAAYGMYSFAMANLTGENGQVYSFEPQPKPQRILRTGVGASGLRNVHVTDAAVGDRPGELEMALPVKFGFAPIHGHAHINDGVQQQRANTFLTRMRSWRTPIRSVDEFRTENDIPRIDFMKVDVEGFEPNVVEGARATIDEHHPSLLLEIEDRHLSRYDTTAAEFTDSLRELGYTMYTWRNPEWVRTDSVTTAQRNYLFTTGAAWDR